MTRLGIENLAKEVLKAVGVAPAPPIPVRLVAERLGVSDISTRPMVEDGALVRLGTVTKVLLREGRSPSRQRFTLAHELAHLLLLGDTELALEFRQVRRGRDAEESLCDDIAAALLMPTEWIRLRFSDRPMTLPTVRDLAQACEVSPADALEVLKAGAAYSRVMDDKGQKMLDHDFSVEARLGQHLKDVRLILAAARAKNAKVPLSQVHRQLLEGLEAAGYGDVDNSAIIMAYE